jgi:hypothetical protein
MNASRRSKMVVATVSLLAVAVAAQAQTPPPQGQGQPAQQLSQQPPPGKPPLQAKQTQPGPVTGASSPRSPDARYMRGAITSRNYGGQAYRGRVAWEGGRWHHEIHNGRNGWWWDVGGVWYYYPAAMDGPPTYVSEDFADDIAYAQAPSPYYPPPPGPYYAAPPPPPPPNPGASAVGGAVVGGLLGGLLTGRASGAAAGAIIGGATGAIAGATAASRPGYYLAQGSCYYRYPDGQYVPVDPRSCY